MWSTHRTITEEENVEREVDALIQKYPRFEDQWDGLKWILCRHPEMDNARHQVINGKKHWLAHTKGDLSHDLVEIAVIYTFDENEVCILGVGAFEATNSL